MNMTDNSHLYSVLAHFSLSGTVSAIAPLGAGLINDTYRVTTAETTAPDYVLQRINDSVFTDVDLLQHNIEAVTRHIRGKLLAAGVSDIDRRVLRFIPTDDGKTYWRDAAGHYWRVSVFIDRARTIDVVDEMSSRSAGLAFGQFEAMLADLPDRLGETIPDFHNMGLRYRQLCEAVAADRVGRVEGVRAFLDAIDSHIHDMCAVETLAAEGRLPLRVCHCDTKVNNVMFDEQGEVLCVVDLDTTMPGYVFSDYGDFLRSSANTVAEDCPDLDRVDFRMDIFRAFTDGYLESTASFLTPVEREHLPYAAALFPYMQSVRFLWDYLSGDHYWKCTYPEHNLVRARNQWRLFESVMAKTDDMRRFIASR